ncbi:sigma-54-dependent transcriptional regulator [Desulfobacula phenolica]|uniref:Two-component system, NtrC family, response regulator n=1 Tax=Desulfobacula phenolica TaxID=90732 RepID=A0A1H2DMY0_9BACT|nr:sigma-54 dependent transcriptional regulator [Desulfobacula phenolica]SDT84146.1 two-component system, NtrC family, response regulator [Desulfobacula phenolica]
MPKVLIIDDDELICETLVKVFNRMGYDIFYQLTLKDGLEQIFADNIDIVFLDVSLPDGNGLQAIKSIKKHPFAPEIIIITGNENIDGAELAIRSNAWDYISKTGSMKKFKFALDRAFEYRKQKQAVQSKHTVKRDLIIGESPLILSCIDKVSKAAVNDIPVLISGETGTGKELFSRMIHINSKRSHAGFIVVDCAALPEYLVESTLFGHVKGAFTGADSSKAGLMEMADKGTLFLDEVGELPLNIQKKFLRALQEKQFRPVGGQNEIKSDFRLISATHRDIGAMVKENKFREDFYFRIFSMNIHLPPLKDRKDDIKLIVQNHLSNNKNFSKENLCSVSDEFLRELQIYDWPGNVRELITIIDLAQSEAGAGSILFPHHLPSHLRVFNIRNKFDNSTVRDMSEDFVSPAVQNIGNTLKFKDYIEKMKCEYLRVLLSNVQGNIQHACKRSGLSKSQLYRLMQQYDLKNN